MPTVQGVKRKATQGVKRKAYDVSCPRHEALVQVEKLRVDDLKFNLGQRGLPNEGTKAELAGRLIDAIEAKKVCISLTDTA